MLKGGGFVFLFNEEKKTANGGPEKWLRVRVCRRSPAFFPLFLRTTRRPSSQVSSSAQSAEGGH